MKSIQIFCLFLLTIVINCEALDLNRKIKKTKLLNLVKSGSKTKGFPDMSKFIQPFIEGLIEFMIGAKNLE
jgi:hypothetical protein